MSCIAPGFGTGPYGTSPWGGGLDATPGGSIPAVAPFDVYCVGPCGPMSVLLTYEEVEPIGGPTQFYVETTSLDQVLTSGGSAPTTDARVEITTAVPPIFTFDFTVKFEQLPVDFTDITNRHVAIQITDAAGPCVALFFSKIGIAYAGAFHHDGSNNLILDSTFQDLPGSQSVISENEYWSFRVAANLITGAVFIYITKTADLLLIGHQLRYIMPVIPAQSLTFTPTDRTVISVRGTLGQPAQIALDSLCVSSDFIIPNALPVADAGLDQAVRTCSIVQLNGNKSFDPEGADLSFRWRLIDAPIGSQFMFDGVDGVTHPLPSPTGFTNKFYSAVLATLDVVDPITVGVGIGDVLVTDGLVYNIIDKGVDGDGFYLQVDGFVLPDNFTTVTFKLLRQRGISGMTQVNPTFFPDIPGLFKFDLTVFDGGLFSEPAITIVNVTESAVPRGCIPDVKFLWGYLSDFWRLVEDKERIETFWSASAQIVASELLSLWQIEYSKSHRDVQRTFQRRWLNYELGLNEPFPELTTIRTLFGGLRQIFPSAGIAGIPGTKITFEIPFFDSLGASQVSISYTFTGSGSLTAQQVLDQLAPVLAVLNSKITIKTYPSRDNSLVELRINAPFTIRTTVASNAPIFAAPLSNTEPGGTGTGVGVRTFQVDRSLADLDIQPGDVIAIGKVAYRVRSLTDDASDFWPYQRITVLEDIPAVTPSTWSVLSAATSKMVNFYDSHVDVQDLTFFEIFDKQTQLTATIRLQGAWAPENAKNTIGIPGLGILANFINHPTRRYSVYFKSATRLTHIPIDALVADIPYLQANIREPDDTAILRRNIDFYLEEFRGGASIRFVFDGFGTDNDIWQSADTIPVRLWAETTYIDNRPIIEQNFGLAADFTLDDLSQLPSNVDYLSAVRGLWYSYFKGPTLFNLRAGTQILLGLPFAEESGTITEIRNDFSTTNGRILVQDKKNPEIIRSYSFPASLTMEVNPTTGVPYVVGDKIEQFSPLVTGVEVVDYIKDPQWFAGYLEQGAFFEVDKFFKFLVRVDSAAFNLSALLFVQNFILRIKPTYTYPLFVVLRKIGETGDTEVNTTDDIEYGGKLYLFDAACTQFNGANTQGVATMLDEPDPSGGGWQSKLDTDFDVATPGPTYPVSQGTAWGLDHNFFCPEDGVLATSCYTNASSFYPMLDGVFALDAYVSTATFAIFEDSWVTDVPAVGGISPTPDQVITSNGTITDVLLRIDGDAGISSTSFELTIYKNGTLQATIPFTESATSPFDFHSTVSIAVAVGNTISIKIRAVGGVDAHVLWKDVKVQLGASVTWALDTMLPAATYCVSRVL